MAINLNSTNGTGINTANPQSIGQCNSLTAPPQNLQNSASSSSLNNTSTVIPIPLRPTFNITI
jgi:hypothetical protein